MKTNNILYKAVHPEHGTYYFTNLNMFARFLGMQRNLVDFYLRRDDNSGRKDFEWTWNEIDGSDITWKDINPERL